MRVITLDEMFSSPPYVSGGLRIKRDCFSFSVFRGLHILGTFDTFGEAHDFVRGGAVHRRRI